MPLKPISSLSQETDEDDHEVTLNESEEEPSSPTFEEVDGAQSTGSRPNSLSLISSLIQDPFANLTSFAFVCRYNGHHPVDVIGNVVGHTKDASFTAIIIKFFSENPRSSVRSEKAKDRLWQQLLTTCAATSIPLSPWTRHLELARARPKSKEEPQAYARRFRELVADVDVDLLLISIFVSSFGDAALVRYVLDRRPASLGDAFQAVHAFQASQAVTPKRDSTSASQYSGGKRPKMNSFRHKQRGFQRDKASMPPCSRCGKRNHRAHECRSKFSISGKRLEGAATNAVSVAPDPSSETRSRTSDATQSSPSRNDEEVRATTPPPPPPPLPRPPVKTGSELKARQIDIVRDVVFDANGRPVMLATVGTSSLIHLDVTMGTRVINALVDSGAERSLCKLHSGSFTRPGPKITLILADGSLRTTDRYYTGPIKWGGRAHTMQLPAIADLSSELILGMDWLKMANPLVDFQAGTIEPREGALDLESLFSKYTSVFEEMQEMPPSRGVLDADICLKEGSAPPKMRCYRLTSEEHSALQQTIEGHLQKGWIQKSTSRWVSPLLFVRKKNLTLRMVVDFRAVNALSVCDRYPLPLLSELIARASGHIYYTTLDLKSAYHQIRLKKSCTHLTSFMAPGIGQFEYKVLPFGLSNAPSQYQRVMDHVLESFPKSEVSCYLDDILIHTSQGLHHHLERVGQVLHTLQSNCLHLNKDKCEFAQSKVEWLGYTLSKQGHAPIRSQLVPILNWKLPQTVHDLRRFLGTTNYYSKFIRRYSEYVQPLFRHIGNAKKGSKRQLAQWTEADTEIFNSLKLTMAKLPTLCPTFDLSPTEPLDLYTDSSEHAIGAVLQHQGRPIEFFSATLTTHESRWPIRQKELYAVVRALKHWRHICVGRAITVYTDHKSLERVLGQNRIQETRIQRWTLALAEYQLTFKYLPGDSNVVADALSRACFVREYLQDETVHIVWDDYLKDPFWANVISELDSLPQYKRIGDLLYYKQNRICVPSSSHSNVMAMAHDGLSSGHQGVTKSQVRAARDFYWPGMYDAIKQYVQTCHVCAMAKSGRRLKVPTQPLPVAPHPWHTVTMDLIMGLPTAAQGYDAIYVFVDKYSKMVHLAPTTAAVTAEGCVDIFLQHVYRLHGLPEVVISDRDPRFTSTLYRKVMRQFNVCMKMSTAAHAQTDGQTERANRVIGDMLRAYTQSHEALWVEYLPTIEFAINSSPAASTGLTPFEVCYGTLPRQIGFPKRLEQSKAVLPSELMERVATFQKRATEQLQQTFQKAAPAEEPAPPLAVGEEVYVSTHLFKDEDTRQRANKLTQLFRGPFKIKAVLGPSHYRVDFSPIQVKIHDVINIKFLKRTKGTRSNDRPDHIQGLAKDVYAVERIISHKKLRKREMFLVKWLGYPEHEASYIPEESFIGSHAKRLLAEYRLQLARSEAARITKQSAKATRQGKTKRKKKSRLL